VDQMPEMRRVGNSYELAKKPRKYRTSPLSRSEYAEWKRMKTQIDVDSERAMGRPTYDPDIEAQRYGARIRALREHFNQDPKPRNVEVWGPFKARFD
jgi:hypothetical protein